MTTSNDIDSEPPSTDLAEEQDQEAAAQKRAKAEKIGRYVAMFLMPLIIVGMMITGYLGAMHSPTAKDMPLAVAGDPAIVQQFTEKLGAENPDAVDVQILPDREAARQAVFDRDAAGAVYLSDAGATVFTAGGSGPSTASTVTSEVAPELLSLGVDFDTEDVAPLPEGDMTGLGAMFMTTAMVMAGYLPFSFMYSDSPELLRLRRAVPLLAGWAALMAGLLWLVTGPILGVLDSANALPAMGVAWLGVFAIGSVQIFFTRIFGAMASIVGILFLMVLGMPSSNMSMPLFTMPGLHQFLHSFLPMPAIGESLRSVLYFDGVGAGKHLLVLVAGAVIGLGLTVLADSIKRRRNPNPKPMVINMPSLHGGRRPKSAFWRYATLLLFPFCMVTMMLSVMLGSMHEPTPREMPVAVVGATPEQTEQTVDGLEQNMNGLFDFRAVDNADEARDLVADREMVGAYILPSAAHPSATLFTSQAAGSSAQQVVTQVFGQVSDGQNIPLDTEDIAPLPESDSSGTSAMYIAMGWMLSGFMIIVVGANAAPSSRPLRKLLPISAIYSVFMSTVIWLIAGPITGAIDGHFWPLLGVGAVAIFCLSMFAAFFERLIGMLSILPVIAVLMFLGVPSSNGALSIYMSPEIFRVLHDYLPMPAAVESVRSIVYFGGDIVWPHIGTFATWGLISLLLVLVVDQFKPVRTSIEHVTYPPTAPEVERDSDTEHADDVDDKELTPAR